MPVHHHEFLATAPSGRTVIVYQPDDSFNIVDLLLVNHLGVRPEAKKDGEQSAPPNSRSPPHLPMHAMHAGCRALHCLPMLSGYRRLSVISLGKSMMFRVVHTTPKRALSHLLRLKREGEALLIRTKLDPLTEGLWADRVFRYLRKISADPDTFERVIWNQAVALSQHGPRRPIRSLAEMTKVQKKHVERNLITLSGAIDQFEAQHEE